MKRRRRLGLIVAGATLAVVPTLTLAGQASAQTTAVQNAPAIAGSESAAANAFVQIVRDEARVLSRGQNTPAIMAVEADYVIWWAQDLSEAVPGN